MPQVERKCGARVTARPVMLLACGFAPFFPYPSECYNGAQEAPMNIQLAPGHGQSRVSGLGAGPRGTL
jgi:hypothetical protein